MTQKTKYIMNILNYWDWVVVCWPTVEEDCNGLIREDETETGNCTNEDPTKFICVAVAFWAGWIRFPCCCESKNCWLLLLIACSIGWDIQPCGCEWSETCWLGVNKFCSCWGNLLAENKVTCCCWLEIDDLEAAMFCGAPDIYCWVDIAGEAGAKIVCWRLVFSCWSCWTCSTEQI